MSSFNREVPFIATPNGLIILLVTATVAPILLPGAGLVATFSLPLMVMWIAHRRPELGVRWLYLAALPLVAYGSVLVALLINGF